MPNTGLGGVAQRGRPRPLFVLLLRVVCLVLLVVFVDQPICAADGLSFDDLAKRASKALSENHNADAIRLFESAVKLHPAWGEGWWSLGTLLYDQDRFAEAANAFRRFTRLTPKPGAAYAFLGLCEYETRDFDSALQHFRSWARAGWPGSSAMLDVSVFHFALLLIREGEFVEALYLLSPEVVKMGNTPALTEAMGLASLQIRSLPGDYAPEAREMVWLTGLAAAYAAHFPPDYKRANEYADRLLPYYEDHPEVRFFRGTLFNFEKKNSAEAEREFRKLLQISPDHVQGILELANLDLGGNNLPEALALATRARELEPKNAKAHEILGRIWLMNDQPQAAVKELELGERLAPATASIHSQLAIAYGKLGRTREAKDHAALALRLNAKEDIPMSPQEKLSSIASKAGR